MVQISFAGLYLKIVETEGETALITGEMILSFFSAAYLILIHLIIFSISLFLHNWFSQVSLYFYSYHLIILAIPNFSASLHG